MYLVKYDKGEYSDGSGKIKLHTNVFEDREQLMEFKRTIESNMLQVKNVEIYVKESYFMDYKEKFEELYDHIMKKAGVRVREGGL